MNNPFMSSIRKTEYAIQTAQTKWVVTDWMARKNIAIVTSHPIQYQAPWFRAFAVQPDLDLRVFFCHKATPCMAWNFVLLDYTMD